MLQDKKRLVFEDTDPNPNPNPNPNQDKKRLVFEGTVGGDAASLSQLSEDDLRFLFQNSGARRGS